MNTEFFSDMKLVMLLDQFISQKEMSLKTSTLNIILTGEQKTLIPAIIKRNEEDVFNLKKIRSRFEELIKITYGVEEDSK